MSTAATMLAWSPPALRTLRTFLTRMLAPFAILACGAALPWVGALMPVVAPVHYAVGVMVACAAGIVVSLFLVRREASVAVRVSLAHVALLLAYVLGLAIVERLMPAGDWGLNGGVRYLDITPLGTDPEGGVLLLFLAIVPAVAIVTWWTSRRSGSGLRPRLWLQAARPLSGTIWWFLILAASIHSGAAIVELGHSISRRHYFHDVLSQLEWRIGTSLFGAPGAARLLLNDAYLFRSRLPADLAAHLNGESDASRLLEAAGDHYSHLGHDFVWGRQRTSTGLIARGLRGSALRVDFVYPNSAADKAGIRRGDEIHRCHDGLTTSLDAICGQSRHDRLVIAHRRADGDLARLALERGNINRLFVPKHAVFDVADARIGYILLTGFDPGADAEFLRAIESLRRDGVTDLVVDLRLNGGGDQTVALRIAASLVGKDIRKLPAAVFRHNPRYARRDGPVEFPALQREGLDLRRVTFLTSDRTASSSELLIVALSDHIQVTTVGGTTTGKGMGCSIHWSGGWYLCAMDSEFGGVKGTAVPPDGIRPDIAVKEDFRLPLGDPEEPLLRAAIVHIAEEGRAGLHLRQPLSK